MARLQKEMQDLVSWSRRTRRCIRLRLSSDWSVFFPLPSPERVLRGQAQVGRQVRAAGVAGHPERDGRGDRRSDGQQGTSLPIMPVEHTGSVSQSERAKSRWGYKTTGWEFSDLDKVFF